MSQDTGALAADRPVEESSRHDQRAPGVKIAAALVAVTAILAAAGFWASDAFDEGDGDNRVLVDEFQARSAEGVPGVGLPWQPVTGSFGSADGRAVVVEPNADGPRTIVAADVGATNYVLRVEAGTVVGGWGVAFRFVGPYNFWYLQAVPEFGVFNVVRVADGRAQRVGTTRLVELRDAMVIEIRLDGPRIQVRVGDRTIFDVSDDHALGATRVGLLTATAAEGASWERIEVDVDGTNLGRPDVVLRPPLDSATPSTTPEPDADERKTEDEKTESGSQTDSTDAGQADAGIDAVPESPG